MTELYILEKIGEVELRPLLIRDSSEFIAFDYDSHKKLINKNIDHKIIDDFLTDLDRRKIFDYTKQCLDEIEKFDNSDLSFHGVNLVNLIDRNELHEYFMDIVPKIKVIKKILQEKRYKKIFLPRSIFNIFIESEFKEKINLIDTNQDEFTSFEVIKIPIKIGNFKSKITIGRKKYKIIKNTIEKLIGHFINSRKNNKQKIILLEFDPEIYHILLNEINKSGFTPIFINFRKSPIYNFKTLQYLIKSNSKILILEDWLEKNQQIEFQKNKKFYLNNINKMIDSKKNLLNFNYDNVDFSFFIQNKLNQLLIQRFDEYLVQILTAESIQSRNDVQTILTLNFSGETEKVFSSVGGEIPILHLQHAFANYVETISHFDILDDFDSVKDKIAVWGDIVRDYLINVKKIDQRKIFVTGSPKYDFYGDEGEKNFGKKKILVTLRPIITHMEGPRISLFDKYKETLQKIIQLTENHSNLEIIFKLHPQQNMSNEIIKNMIDTNDQIKFFQDEPIKKLFQNCDLHVNIATDNFDASSVILEAMLFKKPTLNIELQQNRIEFEFIKDKAIKTVHYTNNINNEILELLDEKNSVDLVKNSQQYLDRYLRHRDSASLALIDAITKIS